MRVVIINRYASAGAGAEKHAVGLAGSLRSHGHAVLTLSTIGEANVEREGAFVPLTGTDFWQRSPQGRQRIEVALNAIWNRRAAAAMRALIARFRPSVVHAHDLYPQLSAAPVAVAARHGLPVVQTLHNYELISASAIDHRGGALDRSEEAPASVRALRSALHLTKKVLHRPHVSVWIAVSRYVAEAYGEHGIRAHVLPNFVAPGGSSQVPGFDERTGAVFVGRLTAEKGVDDVIALATRLPSLPVTVIGRGPLAERARVAAERLDNLTYAGFLSGAAVAARLRSARLAIVPSRWQEPAGLVALEAMAEGTPVVAYASGGLAEYVASARGGRVVPPTVGDMVRAVTELYDDRRAWRELSTSGHRATAADHSPERYVERLEQLYRAALAGTPS